MDHVEKKLIIAGLLEFQAVQCVGGVGTGPIIAANSSRSRLPGPGGAHQLANPLDCVLATGPKAIYFDVPAMTAGLSPMAGK